MHIISRYAVIIIVGALLFIPFLGNVHLFDWDEINFAECAREMIVSDDYLRMQINYKPFWEKPPLFIWLQALSINIFGIGEFAARLPNAIAGIATLVCLFYTGKKILNEKLAMWWAILYIATWLPHFYFKSGIIDPLFNLFIFLAFVQFYLLQANNKVFHALLSGTFLGLAVMTKGPVAILIAVLALMVYVIKNRGLNNIRFSSLLLLILMCTATTGIWFAVEIYNHGIWFVKEFIVYQIRLFKTEDAGHGGPFFYHFIILLLGCFPASVFLFQFFKKQSFENRLLAGFTSLMWIMFWVVLILFSVVKTKIVHYSSLCYFPLTYLASLQIYWLSEKKVVLTAFTKSAFIIIGVLLSIAIIAIPIVGINKAKLIPLIKDPFAVANLQADISWSYLEAIWGTLYLVGIVISVLLLRKRFRLGMIALCVLQVVIIQVTVIHFTPKIEAFSQRAAIEYFKSFQGKDVYVHVLGYKSYAHLFYTHKQPQSNDMYDNEAWLLEGKIDKPAYFICKIIDADKYKAYKELRETGRKNGFVFFERIP
ncbi:hypothetical protein CAP35_09185 [Chitinophagaceae bacterium IBVUCB1]|nr:hypothetical protein CAP35_09185 [Chitinophagaceae bacterium IBVUCB1]